MGVCVPGIKPLFLSYIPVPIDTRHIQCPWPVLILHPAHPASVLILHTAHPESVLMLHPRDMLLILVVYVQALCSHVRYNTPDKT